MAKFVNPGESVECNASEIAVRKISKRPLRVKVEGISLFKYKSGIRSIVTITEELNPKQYRICASSNLHLSDTLEGETLDIYIEKLAKFNLVSNYSHVHSIQLAKASSYTYATIILPWKFIMEMLQQNKQNLLE